MFHISNYADQLRCAYCGKTCKSNNWPTRGDMTPFYFQKEEGNHSIAIQCPHCGTTWYVVWDSNPGPIQLLFGL